MNITKGIVTMLAAAALSGVSAAEKSIVVYFSHTGENYAVGNITEGNTAKVAKVIAAKTGAELYEIKEAKPYPVNYQACVDLAKKELRSNARPELAGKLPDLSAYSVIYLGYPNWWGDAPMVIIRADSCDTRKSTPFYFKNLVRDAVLTQNSPHPRLVGVRDENLPEMLLTHHVQQLGDAVPVQLVENVIQ